jgi:hypothetical protein
LAVVLVGGLRTQAQELPSIYPQSLDGLVLPRRIATLDAADRAGAAEPLSPSARFSLFRMPTGFLSDPIGLDSDEPGGVWADRNDNAATPAADVNGRLGLALGTDNPFFDIRVGGDPGGVGYYKVHSQYQLFGDRNTSCSVCVQAVTPAGPENDGAPTGPTVLSPNLALSHEVDGGWTVHGFVGNRLAARPGWTDCMGRAVQYGLAVQSPLTAFSRPAGPGVHMFVEALGGLGRSPEPSLNRPAGWGIIPGVHWRLTDSWWVSSGLVVPVGNNRPDTGLVQITCSWRF